MSGTEAVFIKQERYPIVDLTKDDNTFELEPEIENIATSIRDNINSALNDTLEPFVSQYNSRKQQYQTISSVLKLLPEFQKLVSENAELKLELNNMKQMIKEKNKITLEVKEKNYNVTGSNNSIIKTSHQNEDIKNTAMDTEEELVQTFYKELQYNDSEDGSQKHPEDDNEDSPFPYNIDDSSVNYNEDEGVNDDEDDDSADEGDEEDEMKHDEDDDSADEGDEMKHDEDDDSADEGDEVNHDEDDDDDEDDDSADEGDEEDEMKHDEDDDSADEGDEVNHDEDDEDEEEELYIVELEMNNKTLQFYTNDDENGDMYKILENDEIGDIVGTFKNGEAIFNK